MTKRVLSLIAILFWSVAAWSQDRVVTGTVTSALEGEPLIGVNVLIKGTSSGTVTDLEGNYSITIPESNTILVFSYVGFLSDEVQVGNQSEINIALTEDVAQLEELVVVGYGVQKKSVVTGAIAKVESDDITQVATPRIDQAIQGQVAGVQIAQSSGQPGSGQTVIVRGIGTNGNYNPLYIIDGVPTDNMAHINPADVESIEILKDAASAAIYGARGANGVILISTKKGEKGQTSISYDGYYGVQQAWKIPEMLNAEQYVELMNERVENDNETPSANLPAVGDPLPYNTNWMEEIFQTAPIQNHQVTATAGSENASYLFSGSYFDQQGIIGGEKSRFTRYTLRLNSTADIKDFITFGNNLSYMHIEQRRLPENTMFSSPLADAYNLDPLFPVNDPNADRGWAQSRLVGNELINPLSRLDITNNKNIQDKILGNIYLQLELLEGLKFRTDFGGQMFFSRDENFTPTYSYTNTVFNDPNLVNQGTYRSFQWQWENVLSYEKQINDHFISVLGGITALENTGSYLGASVRNIPVEQENNPNWWYIDPGVDSTENAWSGADIRHSLYSQFARVNYNFKEKYLFTAIVRRDGSSNFGPNNKYAIFPSVSLGWVASNENFWNVPFMDFLKVRASYGQNGNEGIPALQYTSVISRAFRTYEFGKPTSEGQFQGASPAVLSNPNVQWETSEQFNAGLDFGFLNSKVTASLDYFIKNTNDLLMPPIIEATRGNDPANENVGSVRNSGLELELSYATNFGDVSFNTSFNASYLRNEVTNVSNEDGFLQGFFWPTKNVEITRMEEGEPIGYFLGYKTSGVFQSEEEVEFDWINNEGDPLQPNAEPGDLRIVDVNGDGVINDLDKTNIGNPWPDLTFGGTVGAAYKGFDISLLFSASIGNDIYKVYKRQDLPYANLDASWLDRWTEENPSNEIPRLSSTYRESDFFVEDGSFLRIRNITFGYNLPQNLLEKAKIKQMRVYLAVDNLLTITGYSGFDPEIGSTGWILQSGIDQGFYPQARTTRVGLNVSF